MSKRISNKDFINRIAEINPKITIIGEYKGSKTKVLVQCNTCGYQWYSLPCNLYKGHSCPHCYRESITKTHEQFVKDASINNPYVDIVGKYINNVTNIDVRCKHCGEIYSANPLQILNGSLHKKCSYIVKGLDNSNNRKSHNDFVDELYSINPNIKVLSKYTLSKNKVNVSCNICGYNWSAVANSLLSGSGCPECAKKRVSELNLLTHDEFIEKAQAINPHVEVLGTYINSKTKILIKCKRCGHIEEVIPSKLLTRIYNCKVCSDGISFPNRFMAALLDELHINYIPEKTFDWSDNKRYDFYLTDYNIIVEMHGKQHYTKNIYNKTVKRQKENDMCKMNLANENGISNYISINASISSFDYIWDNVINIDFFKDKICHINKQSVLIRCLSTSKIIQTANYYNDGFTKNVDLQKLIGSCKDTITSYVKRAKLCGLINNA